MKETGFNIKIMILNILVYQKIFEEELLDDLRQTLIELEKYEK